MSIANHYTANVSAIDTLTHRQISERIRYQWARICARAGVSDIMPTLPESVKLFGSGSKTEKGEKENYKTSICYMSPSWELWGSIANANGRTMCPMASGTGGVGAADERGRYHRLDPLVDGVTDGCIDSCLAVRAGRMVMRPVHNARRWKSALFLGSRELWIALARSEAVALARWADRQTDEWSGVLRADGGSDTGVGSDIAADNPSLFVYDYTKIFGRIAKYLRGEYAPNYHLTFSYSGYNLDECLRALDSGVNVAAAWSGDIPESHLGYDTYDGDRNDLRFLDTERGQWCALGFKSATNKKVAAERAGRFLIDF